MVAHLDWLWYVTIILKYSHTPESLTKFLKGAYCYIVWGIHIRHILNGDQEKYTMVWTKFWKLPELVKKPARVTSANGQIVNGHHK